MATELGKAYVQIMPSAKGISSKISKELGAEIKPALKSMEKSIGQSITSSLSSISKGATAMGTALTNKITKPALLAVSALGGLSIWKGFGRLKDMDMAQAKLRGIGIEGETLQKVLEGASEAVLGTSHTTAEAVNVASTAIASGVKAGEDLNSYLKNVADAASFANVPLTDMGGIFSKVQAQGKLTGMVVNQLASHGIGIVGILAEETGKSMESITEDIRKGAVSAEMFYDAMHNYMGGAAAEIGDTFDVALKNIGSRIGILGEKFLGSWKTQEGAFYVLKDVMQEFLNYLPTLYDKAEELGVKFGNALSGIIEKVKEIKGWFAGLDEDTQNLIKNGIIGFGILAVGLGPALKGFGTLAGVSSKVSGIFSALGGSLGGISPMLGGIVSAFSALGPAILGGGAIAALGLLNNAFGDQINAMLTLAMEKGPELIQNLTQGIVEKLPELMASGTEMLTSFIEAINVLLPEIVLAGVEIISALIQGFAENLPAIIESIISLVSTIIITLIDSIPYLIKAGISLISGLARGFIDNIPAVLESMEEILDNILDVIFESLPMIIDSGIELISSLAQGIWDNLPAIIESITKILGKLLDTIIKHLPDLIRSGIEIISKLSQGIWDNLPAIVKSITNVLGKLLDAIIKYLPGFLQKGVELIGKLAQGIWNNLPQIITTMGNLLVRLIGAIRQRLPEFLQQGIQLIGRLALGIVKAIPGIVAKIPQVISALVRTFSSLIGQFVGIGANIVKGLWRGISSVKNWILGKIKGFVGSITKGIKSFFGIKSPSKVMADEVGKWLPVGLADGILDNVKPVTKAMDELGNITMRSFESDFAFSAAVSGSSKMYSSLGSGIASGLKNNDKNVTIEVVNYNQSPEPLTEREIARQTKLELQKLAYLY